MNYFKDVLGGVYAFDNEQTADEFGPSGITPMSAEEVNAHLNHGSTNEEITKTFEVAIQQKINASAIESGYDSINTAVSYAEEPSAPKFQNEGRAYRTWRSLVWAYAYAQLALILAGEVEQPTVEAFLADLPALELPT